MENTSEENQAALLEKVKSVPGLESVIERETGMKLDGAVSRKLVCMEVDDKKEIASFILDEIRFNKRNLETHYNKIVGVFYKGSYNYKTFNYACADKTVTNSECDFTKITDMATPYEPRVRSALVVVAVEPLEGEGRICEISIQR